MAGMEERRPSATRMASGKAKARPKVARIRVIGSPPQRSCGTNSSPRTPPHIRTPIAVSVAADLARGWQAPSGSGVAGVAGVDTDADGVDAEVVGQATAAG